MRVRFAPSPTGYLHIGSARTFIFNWLYARHNGGTVILRIDDTDVERNTEVSLNSIFEGLKWLDLGVGRTIPAIRSAGSAPQAAEAIFEKGLAYRDFTPAHSGDEDDVSAKAPGCSIAGMRELSPEESDRRAAAGEPFVLRFRVPREGDQRGTFEDQVFGAQSPRWRRISKTSLFFAATACRRITWRPAPMTWI